MERKRRYTGRTAVAGLFGLAVLVASCTDRSNPVSPGGETGGGGTGPGTKPGTPVTLQSVECKVAVKTKTVSCGDQSAGSEGGPSAVIVGNQNVFVKVTSSNVNYDAGLQRLTFDVNVRNLIPQPLGTADGVALDPAGVRIFFYEGPTVTSGTGAVTVVADGTAAFTAANQPYYQYNEVLSQYELSPSRQWRLDMPPSVNEFTFKVMISAAVPFPNGWVEVTPGVHSMPALETRTLTAIVRDFVGRQDTTGTLTVNWNTSDPNVATVTPTGYQAAGHVYTATLTGVQAGTTSISATTSIPEYGGVAAGQMTPNIGGIQRIWLGTASSDYNLPGNWRHGRVPVSADTAVINGDTASVMPVMAQNNTVGGVIMQPGVNVPSINLSSFDYTLTSSIDHGATGVVLGTGRMIFTGTAKTISGGLSNVDYRNARFTGTYSLGANLNVTGGRIVVQGGRLRNQGFRIRVRPN